MDAELRVLIRRMLTRSNKLSFHARSPNLFQYTDTDLKEMILALYDTQCDIEDYLRNNCEESKPMSVEMANTIKECGIRIKELED